MPLHAIANESLLNSMDQSTLCAVASDWLEPWSGLALVIDIALPSSAEVEWRTEDLQLYGKG